MREKKVKRVSYRAWPFHLFGLAKEMGPLIIACNTFNGPMNDISAQFFAQALFMNQQLITQLVGFWTPSTWAFTAPR
jgi:hypothetical protein